jgi:hypothetical protein
MLGKYELIEENLSSAFENRPNITSLIFIFNG